MGWLDPAISFPRVTLARLEMLINEVYYLEEGEELDRHTIRELAEKMIANVMDEYVRQHFEESTKVAAQMLKRTGFEIPELPQRRRLLK